MSNDFKNDCQVSRLACRKTFIGLITVFFEGWFSHFLSLGFHKLTLKLSMGLCIQAHEEVKIHLGLNVLFSHCVLYEMLLA